MGSVGDKKIDCNKEVVVLTHTRTSKMTPPSCYKWGSLICYNISILPCGAAGGLSRHSKLEIIKKRRQMAFLMLDMKNMTYLSTLPLFVNNLCFCRLKTRLKTCSFTQQWLVQLLPMTSYLVTIVANSHQTCVKMCLRDMGTAHPPPQPLYDRGLTQRS